MVSDPLTQPSPHYRPDVDGLRAIAVLLVLGFHAFPNRLPGGFVGVDIFFVISGYLISGIIIRDLRDSRFTFGGFYKRRIRRILPALIVILVFSLAFGWWVLLAHEYSYLNKHIASAAGFVSNFTLWNEAGYFDLNADIKPLSHLWSLAIEEQFYILWPLMVALAWRRKWNIAGLISLIAAASFAANIVTVNESYVAAFYSPACRIWELMTGGLFGYLMVDGQQPVPAKYANLFGIIGLALIGAAVFLIDSESAFPGWWALLPAAGALGVIVAGASWPNRLVLSYQPLVWIGLISYPLYLWHWPLLVFARIVFGLLGSPAKFAILVISFGCAFLTYVAVERPVRWHFSGKVVTALAGLLVAIFAVSSLSFLNGALPRNRDEVISKLVTAAFDWDFPGAAQRISEGKLRRVFAYRSRLPSTTVFIGDSHIEQYLPRIAKLIDEAPDSVNSAIFIGNQDRNCWPMEHVFVVGEGFCHGAINDIRNLALANTTEAFVLSYAADHFLMLMRSPTGRDSLARFMRLLTESGKRVYIILPNPEGNELAPLTMYTGSRLARITVKPADETKFDAQAFSDKFAGVQNDLKKLAIDNGGIAIDPFPVLCGSAICPVFDASGVPLYRDSNHPRPSYVRSSASFIDVTLRPNPTPK
jgi:peptidoglycan/LPS O-acetylase OafA/YrhL